jgi:hypothetical protein
VKIENRQQLLLFLAAAAIALLVGDELLLKRLTKVWKDRSERIAKLRKDVDAGEKLLTRDASLRGTWTKMRTNSLSANISVAEQQMLEAFDRWSRDANVTITSVKPQWKRATDDYLTLECRVDASGRLSTISKFLYNLEKDPIAVRVESVELSARDTDGGQLNLGLQVSGLVLQSNER